MNTSFATSLFIPEDNSFTYPRPDQPYSIYIPRVSNRYDENDIARIFGTHMGVVERVDLTPINPRQGFSRMSVDVNTGFKSCFVHFSSTFNYVCARTMLKILESEGTYILNNSPTEYFVIKKNYRPIPSIVPNMSQIVDNCRFLENKIQELSTNVESQNEKIRRLEEQAEEQNNTIKRLQDTVYQLLGLLVDQQKEEDRIFVSSTVDYMYHGANYSGPNVIEDDEEDPRGMTIYEMPWYNGPEWTDPNSTQNLHLEENDLSCNSSLPSLVSITSEEYNENEKTVREHEHSSFSSSSSSSSSSSQRIQNSYDLCGNN